MGLTVIDIRLRGADFGRQEMGSKEEGGCERVVPCLMISLISLLVMVEIASNSMHSILAVKHQINSDWQQ